MRLHYYFARKFAWTLSTVLGIFLGILMLLDIAEQLRKYGSERIGFGELMALSALNVPMTLYRVLPLIVILATLALFLGLARSSELVVTRAAGRSAMRALSAPVLVALLFGMVAVAVLNPIVAATSKEYEARANEFASGQRNTFSISGEGLWLRQGGPEGQTVIHARQASLDGTRLSRASFLSFSPDGTPSFRIEAETATLIPGAWILKGVKSWPLSGSENPERDSETRDELRLPSELTRDQIRDSFGTPSAIPIWDLPAFIRSLDRAGFSARKHRVWLQMELALPFMFVAMVLLGAGFTMRHARFGRTGVMALTAILMGFVLFFIRNFAQVLGESGQIPVLLAAWSPPLAAIFLSLGLLLHLEDG
ncbi:MAG: LPS export ABC transporter permease LptG [Halocynthiibacter sp.]